MASWIYNMITCDILRTSSCRSSYTDSLDRWMHRCHNSWPLFALRSSLLYIFDWQPDMRCSTQDWISGLHSDTDSLVVLDCEVNSSQLAHTQVWFRPKQPSPQDSTYLLTGRSTTRSIAALRTTNHQFIQAVDSVYYHTHLTVSLDWSRQDFTDIHRCHLLDPHESLLHVLHITDQLVNRSQMSIFNEKPWESSLRLLTMTHWIRSFWKDRLVPWLRFKILTILFWGIETK